MPAGDGMDSCQFLFRDDSVSNSRDPALLNQVQALFKEERELPPAG